MPGNLLHWGCSGIYSFIKNRDLSWNVWFVDWVSIETNDLLTKQMESDECFFLTNMISLIKKKNH